MKKFAIYALALLATVFTSCTEDFTDWAEPQGFEQEEAVGVSFSVTAVDPIDMATVTSETVSVFTPSVSAEGMTSVSYKIKIEGTTLDTDGQGNIPVAELKKITESEFGKAPEQRTLAATVTAYIAIGEEVLKETAFVEIKVTLVAPNISSAYYLVGDMCYIDDENNGWNAASMQKFTHSETNVYDDPIFKIVFTTIKENSYWKIIPQDNMDAENFWANPGVLGTAEDGDASMSGNLVNENAQAGKIEAVGKYVMTIDMLNSTYKIEEAPEFENMFINGSAYSSDWNWASAAQMVPVHSAEGMFWSIQYYEEGEEIKFSPDAAWSGREFGYSTDWLDDASIELAGLSDSGGNIKIGKSGWYTVIISISATSKSIQFIEPNVYLIGDTMGAWDAKMEKAKFEVPTDGNGEFVSPAFEKEAEIRAYVDIPNTDWWKSEFMVFDGKLVYRGNGNDQERIKGKVGEKLYLNFGSNTGSIK